MLTWGQLGYCGSIHGVLCVNLLLGRHNKVPDFSPPKEGKYDRHLHSYCCSLFPWCLLKRKKMSVISPLLFSFLSFFSRSWPLKAVEPTDAPLTHQQSSPPSQKKRRKKKFKGFSLSWVLPLYGACSKYHTVTNHPCYNILSSEGSHSDSTKPLWCHGVDGVAHFDLLRGELWRHLSASSQPLPSPHTPSLCWETLNSRLEAVILGGPRVFEGQSEEKYLVLQGPDGSSSPWNV